MCMQPGPHPTLLTDDALGMTLILATSQASHCQLMKQ